MAAISLYEKHKFSYLHPQMNSVWTQCVHCAPHTDDALFTVIFCSYEPPALGKSC